MQQNQQCGDDHNGDKNRGYFVDRLLIWGVVASVSCTMVKICAKVTANSS